MFTYILAQTFGILATITCIVMPLFNKKWQILVASVGANLFVCLNFLLLGKMESGAYIAALGVVQSLIGFFHLDESKPVTIAEKIIFIILYPAFGILGFGGWTDLLTIVASLLYMFALFVPKEQDTRKFMIFNFALWCIYDVTLMATSFFGHFAGFCTTAFALWKYRKK